MLAEKDDIKYFAVAADTAYNQIYLLLTSRQNYFPRIDIFCIAIIIGTSLL